MNARHTPDSYVKESIPGLEGLCNAMVLTFSHDLSQSDTVLCFAHTRGSFARQYFYKSIIIRQSEESDPVIIQ